MFSRLVMRLEQLSIMLAFIIKHIFLSTYDKAASVLSGDNTVVNKL